MYPRDWSQMPRMNQLMSQVWDLLSLFSTEEIHIPSDYHTQVIQVKKLLKSDTSGLVNTTLDFKINCALVDYSIETPNQKLTDRLTDWLNDINSSLRGKVPTGINALAKEYFRERWKGSSFLLLRTRWEDVDGYALPTQMWFMPGENIDVKDKNKNERIIGEEIYKIKLNNDEKKPFPKEEEIFIQKPFSEWSDLYPTPFVIQRGLYQNLMFLKMFNRKAERIVGKALEYMMLMKKGTENLALQGKDDFIYSTPELKQIKEELKAMIQEAKNGPGGVNYTSNFDTSIEHIIPEYARALKEENFKIFDKRLLQGCGLIEIVEGVGGSNRKEATLNPKPFIAEVRQGIKDFKQLMIDVIYSIIERNSSAHRKMTKEKIIIHSSPIEQFITEAIRDHLRSMYDRGLVSKQTYAEVAGGDIDFDIETHRRKNETKEGLDKVHYPPVITNVEKDPNDPNGDLKPTPQKKEKTTTDKSGPEKKNFKGSLEVVLGAKCKKCGKEFDYDKTPESCMGGIRCPSCGEILTEKDIEFKNKNGES